MGDMDVVGLYTFMVWLFTAVTGYGMLAALIALSMSLSNCPRCLYILNQVEDISAFMSSESGSYRTVQNRCSFPSGCSLR